MAFATQESIALGGDVPRDLHHPCAVRMNSDASNVYRPGGDVDKEQDMVRDQALQRAHLDTQEVRCRQALPAACLLDLNLAQMRKDIRVAYRTNPEVLGIFPVAAYNGGGRNFAKLYRVLTRMNVRLDELNRPGEQLAGASVTCPCIWKTVGSDARPLAIPKYNNENRWYIQKYQTIVSAFEYRAAVVSIRTNRSAPNSSELIELVDYLRGSKLDVGITPFPVPGVRFSDSSRR